jgi:hypothetical protein
VVTTRAPARARAAPLSSRKTEISRTDSAGTFDRASDSCRCRPDGAIVLLTVFRKTRQHDQRQIDRAVRAQQVCERDHRRPAAQTYERQV